MGCQSKVELNVCQIVFLISICALTTIAAVVGWFRTIDPVDYSKLSATPSSSGNLDGRRSFVYHHVPSLISYLDVLGSPPVLNNPHFYIQWTFLQMNDVYELKPLGGGKKGGLARVATIRKLLLQENPNTITIMSGDVVSPSALGNSIVNGSALDGRQMIATLNVLGLDYATLGNHEFDLKEASLRSRLNESKFQWIASNVYERNSTKPFHNVLPYKILTISNVKILLIGLTIDSNLGPSSSAPYVEITSQQALPEFTANYIKYLRHDLKLKWDVLICLTHLNLQNDIDIIERNSAIHVLMGGHEHENYYLKRGSKYAPIYKADGNAFSVFIHRFAYQPITKQLLILSKLTQVSTRFSDDHETARIADYYYRAGLQAYRNQGYFPEHVVCTLPKGVSFDGRSAIIRSQQTHLTRALCNSMMEATNTRICVFNSGAIRIDDQLMGTITQYDILRCLPFAADLVTIRVNSSILLKVLNRGLDSINTGMFISYAGIEYNSITEKWYLKSNRQFIENNNLQLIIVSIPYFVRHTHLKHAKIMSETGITIARAFIDYLGRRFKTTRRRKLS